MFLTACVDTHITLDLREPTTTVLNLRASLQPAALNMLKLSNPELIHGNLSERSKQLRTCQAFFSDDQRAKEIFKRSAPVVRDGVTITKVIQYNGQTLDCGFNAQGPAQNVFDLLKTVEMVHVTQANDRFQITLNTRNSEYGNIPDLGFFSFGQNPEDLPKLNIAVMGHNLQSNFEQGNLTSTRFELQENLMGERKHFQTEFVVSVNSTEPSLLDRLVVLFSESWQWLKNKYQEITDTFNQPR